MKDMRAVMTDAVRNAGREDRPEWLWLDRVVSGLQERVADFYGLSPIDVSRMPISDFAQLAAAMPRDFNRRH